jgi:hypothetical protein
VEGDGDVAAVPVLLRRILGERHGKYSLAIAQPKRATNKEMLIRDFERIVQNAVITPGCGGVIVLVDTDGDDYPVVLACGLRQRALKLNLSVPVAIVCPQMEYEAWFLASLESIRGKSIKGRPGKDAAAENPPDCEAIRGAKE